MDCIPVPISSCRPLTTILPNEAVRIRISNNETASHPPRTVPYVFRETVRRHGDRPALVSSTGETLNYKQYWDTAYALAKSFMKGSLLFL